MVRTAAAFFSFIGNTISGGLLGVFLGETGVEFVSGVIGAPVIEEIFKAAGFVVMAWHFELEDTLDGILYELRVDDQFTAEARRTRRKYF